MQDASFDCLERGKFMMKISQLEECGAFFWTLNITITILNTTILIFNITLFLMCTTDI